MTICQISTIDGSAKLERQVTKITAQMKHQCPTVEAAGYFRLGRNMILKVFFSFPKIDLIIFNLCTMQYILEQNPSRFLYVSVLIFKPKHTFAPCPKIAPSPTRDGTRSSSFPKVPDLYSHPDSPRNRFYHSSIPRGHPQNSSRTSKIQGLLKMEPFFTIFPNSMHSRQTFFY